jgi:hypothetical protein
MGEEVLIQFFRFLSGFTPGWALVLLVCGILAFRAPQLLHEIFAGIGTLLMARRRRKK